MRFCIDASCICFNDRIINLQSCFIYVAAYYETVDYKEINLWVSRGLLYEVYLSILTYEDVHLCRQIKVYIISRKKWRSWITGAKWILIEQNIYPKIACLLV